MSLLYDFYGEILTEKQRDFFDLYYNNDLSLGEIAENAGITRQGVRDVIARAEQILTDMETKLRLVARHRQSTVALEEILRAADLIETVNNRLSGHGDIRAGALAIRRLAMELLT